MESGIASHTLTSSIVLAPVEAPAPTSTPDTSPQSVPVTSNPDAVLSHISTESGQVRPLHDRSSEVNSIGPTGYDQSIAVLTIHDILGCDGTYK